MNTQKKYSENLDQTDQKVDANQAVSVAGKTLKSGKRLVIIPAYNESASIAKVVADVALHAPKCDILVVDDGSSDDTSKQVPCEATVIKLPFNLGIGGAMQAGYRYALLNNYDAAIQVDADGQHPAADIQSLFYQLDQTQADMVIGSRFIDAAGYKVPMSRKTGIVMIRKVIHVLSGYQATDPTSGFRATNRNLIALFTTYYPDDYPEPEVILLAARKGLKIVECPVEMAQRTAGQSSISFAKGIFYVIKVSVALCLGVIRHPW